ncbi:DUF4892 domain-containing protein [Pontibacter sp. JAM-7]|uniref:DUF4892 domain-containing protein n=1 Tax=Pontibacter sp. JAM-7 TaxID=3366581 RepID=UPI003AF45A0B
MRLVISGITLLCIWSGAAFAEPTGARDYPQLQRFSKSEIVQYDSVAVTDYRFILGGLEKVNGLLRPEQEQRIDGQLTQITYRIPDSHTAAEVFQYFQAQIESLGAEVQFQCQGRACGSSNHWANDIFGYFRLYGSDAGQYFAALKNGDRYFSLYSITRGNRRVFTRLEIVETGQQVKSSAQHAISLLTQADIDDLAAQLLQSGQSIWLVSYAVDGSSHTENLASALGQLEQMRDRLVAAGAPAELIKLHPLGSFILPSTQSPPNGIFAYTDSYQESETE